MSFLTIFVAAAASMQQYAAIQHSNNEHSPELFSLPQITPIYQMSCLFMHAVSIYWVCCKIATMLHICCSMQLQPVFFIQELSQTVFKNNWVILKLNLPSLGILTKNEIFDNICCCSCKYAAICRIQTHMMQHAAATSFFIQELNRF